MGEKEILELIQALKDVYDAFEKEIRLEIRYILERQSNLEQRFSNLERKVS